MSYAPVTVNGRKVTPTFAWPDWYIKELRADAKQIKRQDTKTPAQIAEDYTRWLAEQCGVNLAGANCVTINHAYRNNGPPYVKSVLFHKTCSHGQHYYSGGRSRRNPNFTEPVLIAEIEIPFAGWQPKIIETEYVPLDNAGGFYNLVRM